MWGVMNASCITVFGSELSPSIEYLGILTYAR